MRLVRFERTCRISIGIHSDAARFISHSLKKGYAALCLPAPMRFK